LLPYGVQLQMIEYFLVESLRHTFRLLILLLNIIQLAFTKVVQEGIQTKLTQHRLIIILIILNHSLLFALSFCDWQGNLYF
jgi:hypothetical protein